MDHNTTMFWLQLVSTVFIGATFIIYSLQLKAMREASTAQNTLSVINFLQQSNIHKARQHVWTNLKDKHHDTWDTEDLHMASLVQSSYDITGILVKHGLVPRDIFLSNWGDSIVMNYNILEPNLKKKFVLVGSPSYGANFLWLRNEVLKAVNSTLQSARGFKETDGARG